MMHFLKEVAWASCVKNWVVFWKKNKKKFALNRSLLSLRLPIVNQISRFCLATEAKTSDFKSF